MTDVKEKRISECGWCLLSLSLPRLLGMDSVVSSFLRSLIGSYSVVVVLNELCSIVVLCEYIASESVDSRVINSIFASLTSLSIAHLVGASLRAYAVSMVIVTRF